MTNFTPYYRQSSCLMGLLCEKVNALWEVQTPFPSLPLRCAAGTLRSPPKLGKRMESTHEPSENQFKSGNQVAA
jgi:hypothetical protein